MSGPLSLAGAREIRAGSDDLVIRMRGCPNCAGWGWICLNPFAPFNRRFVQCPTCERAKAHFDEHGTLPEDVAAALAASTTGGQQP